MFNWMQKQTKVKKTKIIQCLFAQFDLPPTAKPDIDLAMSRAHRNTCKQPLIYSVYYI